MNHMSSVIRIHYKSKHLWFSLPWMILITSFMVNVVISVLLGGKVAIYTGGLSSIYIYAFIVGIAILNDTFPFALGFSVRRTDYFLGTTAMVIIVSAVTAILLSLFSFIESQLLQDWNIGLHFFHLPYLGDGPLVAQFWIFFAVMVHLYFLGIVITSIYQRFRRNGMITFFATIILLSSIFTFVWTYLNWWSALFDTFQQHSAAELATWLSLVTIIYMFVSYLLLRKASV